MLDTVRGQTPQSTQRARVGNLHVDGLTLSQVMDRLEGFVASRRPHHVVTANMQFVTTARRLPDFASIVNSADLTVADGRPVMWLARLAGMPIPERVTGNDLLHGVAGLAARRGYSIFLLGGGDGIADAAAKKLAALYPGVRVVGTHHGYKIDAAGCHASAAECEDVARRIRNASPDFLFVGLGCPKQEFWTRRHINELGVPVSIGVGGAFDLLTGRLNRAPVWMQRAGLEWSYRLKQEPGRLWKRYILMDLPTAARLTISTITLRARRGVRLA